MADAIGHRVVHGGLNCMRPVRVDTAIVAELERIVPLAPLHQPHKAAAWLGVTLDTAANARNGPRISAHGAVRAWVVPTDEELMIARHTRALLGVSA